MTTNSSGSKIRGFTMFSLDERGFTLIELLIAIAVIVLLTAGILTLINPLKQFAKARDAERKKTLRELANALERYNIKKGSYPITAPGAGPGRYYSSEPGDGPRLNGPGNLGDWIPGLLASKEIIKLPRDPKGGNSDNPSCTPGDKRTYSYRSDDGSCYKLLSSCAPEVLPLDPNDPFFDSTRQLWAWQVCSPPGSVCCGFPF